MSSASIINNKFDGNDYRVSIVRVHKRLSIPSVLDEVGNGIKFEPTEFDNICFEAAIYTKRGFWKPVFVIELDEMRQEKAEEEFPKLMHHIIANEKFDELTNFKDGLQSVYGKYGFWAMRHDIWSLFTLGKIKTIFIFKDPCKS